MSPAPGSTVTGCGADLSGCVASFDIGVGFFSNDAGEAATLDVQILAADGAVCVAASRGRFGLPAGRTFTVQMTGFGAGHCATPVRTTSMRAILTGPGATTSRQEWSIEYDFTR